MSARINTALPSTRGILFLARTKITTTCSLGVASMGIYTAPNQLAYVTNGASLSTSLTLSAGTYSTTVEEWEQVRRSRDHAHHRHGEFFRTDFLERPQLRRAERLRSARALHRLPRRAEFHLSVMKLWRLDLEVARCGTRVGGLYVAKHCQRCKAFGSGSQCAQDRCKLLVGCALQEDGWHSVTRLPIAEICDRGARH